MARTPVLFVLSLCALFVLASCSNQELSQAKQDVNNATAKIAEISKSLDQAQAQATAALQQAKQKGEELQNCLADADAQQNKTSALLKSLGNDVAVAHTDLKACQDKLAQVADNEAVIADAARRLCCVQRVEHPEIDSFSVENNKIVCKAGGTKTISC